VGVVGDVVGASDVGRAVDGEPVVGEALVGCELVGGGLVGDVVCGDTAGVGAAEVGSGVELVVGAPVGASFSHRRIATCGITSVAGEESLVVTGNVSAVMASVLPPLPTALSDVES